MFKIQFGQAVAVSLGSEDGNDYAPQEWEGEPRLVAAFQRRLEFAHGAFGHSLGDFTTPIDLHYAVMSNLAEFDPQVVEGAEIIETYDPGIPEGAVT